MAKSVSVIESAAYVARALKALRRLAAKVGKKCDVKATRAKCRRLSRELGALRKVNDMLAALQAEEPVAVVAAPVAIVEEVAAPIPAVAPEPAKVEATPPEPIATLDPPPAPPPAPVPPLSLSSSRTPIPYNVPSSRVAVPLAMRRLAPWPPPPDRHRYLTV